MIVKVLMLQNKRNLTVDVFVSALRSIFKFVILS